MLLKNKNAVIYGAGGAIGGAVARAFASQGANLFLTGAPPGTGRSCRQGHRFRRGSAEAAEVDALDEQAVDKHLQSVVDAARTRRAHELLERSATTGKLVLVP